jgi:hypothetical protein
LGIESASNARPPDPENAGAGGTAEEESVRSGSMKRIAFLAAVAARFGVLRATV